MKIQTSKTSPIGINQVVPPTDDGAGWVAITLAPGKNTPGHSCHWKRDLDADLDRLKALGATMLVPLLEDDELDYLKIPTLIETARQYGLAVRRFPFHDGGVPTDMGEARQFVSTVIRYFQKGERIVINCNGGLGRAGTMAACLRLAIGLDKTPRKAISSVRKIRGKRAIETAEQERFIASFYRSWDKNQNRVQNKPGEMSLMEQAETYLPHAAEGKRIIVASRLESVQRLEDFYYRFTWRMAHEDGREQLVTAVFDGKLRNYHLEEPAVSWSEELYSDKQDPAIWSGEERRRWLVCHIMHKNMQEAALSGIYGVEAAREDVSKGES